MSSAIVVATISAVVALAAATITVLGQMRVARLQASVQERLAERQEESAAKTALERYREPVLAAAHDLQSRLYNILEDGFLGYLGSPRADAAVDSTLFRFAQYFGWTEILRRDIQFLNFGETDETRIVAALQASITKTFASDRPVLGRLFMIWWDQQRAIGERMIVEEYGKVLCMGYASFVEKNDPPFRRWLDDLEADIRSGSAATSPRLAAVQNTLCELVERLDAGGVRYGRLKRAPLSDELAAYLQPRTRGR